MPKDIVKKIALYRWRFIVGYGLLAILFIAVLFLATLYVPGGLSDSERQSAVTSVAIDFGSLKDLMQVNIPYHLLQKLSINEIGFNLLGIKMPSIVISFLSAFGLVILLKKWYRHSTSIITTAMMLLSAPFLYIGQQGNATIMTVFWSVYIILLAYLTATNTSKLRYIYAILFAVAIALSLYTPLMIYVLVALGIGAILHPHMRYVIRKRGVKSISISTALTIILLVPFILFCISKPASMITLFVGENLNDIDWVGNLTLVVHQLFNFFNSGPITGILSPIFSLPVVAIAGIGIYSLATRSHSVQSYVIAAWSLLIIPVFIVNPTNSALIFVPVSLLVASGVSYILWYWYGLFPKNPYARLAGLIPVAVLVGSIVLLNSYRYFYTFSYDPQQLSAISADLKLVDRELDKSDKNTVLLVSDEEREFYQAYKTVEDLSSHVTTNHGTIKDFAYRDYEIYATHDSSAAKSQALPERIITNHKMQDSDRLYVYKNTAG